MLAGRQTLSFDAGFPANLRQLRVVALEYEVAERVGHVVLFAARASCFVRVAGKLSKEFVRCNELVRLLPRDEAALPGLGDVVESCCEVWVQSGQLDDGFGRLSVARYCVFVRGVARDAAEMLQTYYSEEQTIF